MSRFNIIFWIAVAGFLLWGYMGKAERDSDGQVVSEGSLDVFAVRVGDCTNEFGTDESEEIQTVSAVPCDEPHDIEFYAGFDLQHAEFPGDEAIDTEALESCLALFEGFVGIPYEESILDITYMYPTAESWDTNNDREVLCATYHMEYEKLVGSARDMQI